MPCADSETTHASGVDDIARASLSDPRSRSCSQCGSLYPSRGGSLLVSADTEWRQPLQCARILGPVVGFALGSVYSKCAPHVCGATSIGSAVCALDGEG